MSAIVDAASAIGHSTWKARVWYSWAISAGLLVGLIACCFLSKSAHIVSTLAWCLVTNNILMLVAPSAEQVVKMLAQVAAIRAGAKSE